MNAQRNKSVASFLSVLLHAAWYAVALAMVLSVCLMIVSLLIDVSGGKMDLPVSFSMDASTLTPEAPGMGIAQLRNARGHGTLVFTPPNRFFPASVSP